MTVSQRALLVLDLAAAYLREAGVLHCGTAGARLGASLRRGGCLSVRVGPAREPERWACRLSANQTVAGGLRSRGSPSVNSRIFGRQKASQIEPKRTDIGH